MSIVPPKVRTTTQREIEARLRALIPHFTPEWSAASSDTGTITPDPGIALAKIYSFLARETIDRLNLTPARNMLAFLDMLGIRLLPKTTAETFLSFRVTDGFPEAADVDAGSLVTASTDGEEVPFETLDNLTANPGAISRLFGIDPERDAIYRPPPGFLEKEFATPPPPRYTTEAFSSTGSSAIQLSIVDGIAPGDILRIGATDHAVTAIKGHIVQLEQPLSADVESEAPVIKRVTFELFGGIDLQEHILYLSHPEYFNLKDSATITLVVDVSDLGGPAPIVWEVYADDPITKTARWMPLSVVGDDTAGLSKSGNLTLFKPKIEIKESEVNGSRGRWIRARRAAKIALGDVLPKLDSVNIRVSGEKLGAEAGFYNDSPLAVATNSFNPLGFEPQIFDRFQVASTEAFSKHRAAVTLNFKFDQTRLLGGPAAVVVSASQARVFARGVLHRLVEVDFISARTFFDCKNPLIPISPGAVPAAAPGTGGTAAVFVRTTDDVICMFRLTSDTGKGDWFKLIPADSGEKFKFDPAAIDFGADWHVFAAVDKQLFHKKIPQSGGAGGDWEALPALAGFAPASAPAVTNHAGHLIVFIFSEDGSLYQVDWDPTTSWNTAAVAFIGGEKCKSAADAHPTAVSAPTAGPAVFFLNDAYKVVAGSAAGFTTLQDAVADPAVVLYTDSASVEHFRVFTTTDGAGTLQFADIPAALGGTAPAWTDLRNPQPVSGRPTAVTTFNGTHVEVFSASTQSSLMRLIMRAETGKLLAVHQDIMPFETNVPVGANRWIQLKDFPNERPFQLKNVFPLPDTAVFQNALPANVGPLPKGTHYRLLDLLKSGIKVQPTGTTTTQVKLDTSVNVTATTNLWLSIETPTPQFVPVQDLATSSDTLDLVSPNTIVVPTNPTNCKLFTLLHEGQTGIDAKTLVLLDGNASTDAFAYKGATINLGQRIPVADFHPPQRIVLASSTAAAAGATYTFDNQWDSIQDPDLDDIDPKLSWEYWNGSNWDNIPVEDKTQDLIRDGSVSFDVPDDLAPTEIAGQLNYWIRARLVGGNYGQVKFETISSTDNGVTTYSVVRRDLSRPPIVSELTIGYKFKEGEGVAPSVVQTFNNLDYIDQTDANTTEDKFYQPFVPLDGENRSVYVGFERPISGGSLLFDVTTETEVDDLRKLRWEAIHQNDFDEIDVKDKTGSFAHTGLVSLNLPFAHGPRSLLGQAAHWVRALLIDRPWAESPELSGLYPNAVRARQCRTYVQEILGSSTGEEKQRYFFQHNPVLDGAVIRVRTALTDEDRERIVKADGEDAVLDLRDEDGRRQETWVLWKEVDEFFDSTYLDRHYRLDSASGEIEFGDGIHGAIPPIGGDNIRAFSYRAGGGKIGNVKANTVTSLVTAVGGIDRVTNPLPAGGGSEAAAREEMMDFGPAELNHRNRAVSPTDYEWLAREASREVVKARCVANRDQNGNTHVGWVSVYIVGRSPEAQPQPSLELRRAVREFLLDRAPAALKFTGHLFVGRPEYVPIRIEIVIVARSIAVAADAERETREKLSTFLHPATGGPDENGWNFGQGLAISALYSVVEAITTVDHVESLVTTPKPNELDFISVKRDQILAEGKIDIEVIVWP